MFTFWVSGLKYGFNHFIAHVQLMELYRIFSNACEVALVIDTLIIQNVYVAAFCRFQAGYWSGFVVHGVARIAICLAK